MDPLQLRQLRERCLEMGMQKSQVQSKTFEAAVHFLSTALLESDGPIKSELEEYRAVIREKAVIIEKARGEAAVIILKAKQDAHKITSDALNEASATRKDVEADLERVKELEKLKRETEAEIAKLDALKAELESMETPQARDAIRKAEYFKASVNIQTTQNNTAFINAMGNVLSVSVPIMSDEVGSETTRRPQSPAELKLKRY